MLSFGFILVTALAVADPCQIVPVVDDFRQNDPCEFRLVGLERGENPYDPECMKVDAFFTAPSGGQYAIPGFWYQGYSRAMENDHEQLQMQGNAEWRVRFRPLESGKYCMRVGVVKSGAPEITVSTSFEVISADFPEAPAWRIESTQKRVFIAPDHKATPLIGFNTCWPGSKGTFDYDRWFDAMQKVGANWGRIWMWPMSMGIEARETERLNYNQYEAWRLDHIFRKAANNGIAIMLCLDYHGMFQDKPDSWGGNDFWPKHPYNIKYGGPCSTQEDFFTMPEAKALYKKRLRYMVARYGTFPSLFCWEFFNEINIPYNRIKPESSVKWHDEMAACLKKMDPFGHMVSTSLAGGGDQPEMWRLSSLDFTQMHIYLPTLIRPRDETAVTHIAGWATHHMNDYGKPMIVGEYGIDGTGFHDKKDPYFRGLRQGVWAGVMSGSAGTSMSWWWDKIDEQNLYTLWGSVSSFLKQSGIQGDSWFPVKSTRGANLEVVGICTRNSTALYVVDPQYGYSHNAREEARALSGKHINLNGLTSEKCEVRYWNPEKGDWMGDMVAVNVQEGAIKLMLPDFSVDLAVAICNR